MGAIETVSTGVPGVDDFASIPNQALESEVRTLAAQIAAATCRFVLLIGELDRREAWKAWGCRSCAHWLSWQCGTSLRTAHEHVRVGRALAALPEIAAAFGTGRLSYSKARALTRVATPESERELLELAREATAAQLDRIVNAFQHAQRLTDPDLAAAQARGRDLWSTGNDDGTRTLHVRLTSDAYQAVMAAVDAAVEQLPELTDDPDNPGGARRADALTAVAREFLAPGADRAPLTDGVLHIDLETLVDDRPGRSEFEHGPSVSSETARRLLCDAGLTVSLEQAGKTLDVGRRMRTAPPAMRRAIVDRDHATCRFPGCTNRRHLAVHHRKHWAKHRGPTSKRNGFLLCPAHHRALHEGGWHADGEPDEALVFVGPKGQRLPEHPVPPPRADHHDLARTHARAGVWIGSDTIRARWKGDPLDLDHAVTAMFGLLDEPPDHAPPTDGADGGGP